MAYVDDPNKNEQEAQVAGAAPLSNVAPTQSQAPTESTPMGSQAPQIQSGASVDQATSQGGVTNKKAPKASSGTYTNIQRYVEKNQPQAQKMSSAVTQDVGKQADQVRQAVEQQKQQQQNVLSANQQAIQAGQDWANQQVQNIMTQPAQAEGATVYTPSQDDISRFQNLMSGNVAGVQQVQDLDLGQQQSRIRALQNLAGQAGTEQGRRNLLGQTFQKQGEYTRGMSGLDELITSGDQAAREGLVTGVQGQAQQLGQDVQSAQQQASQALGEQRNLLSNLGQNITGLASDPLSNIEGGIDTAYEQTLAERAALLDPQSEAYQQALSGIEQQLASGQGQLGNLEYANLIESLIPQAYQRAQDVYGIGSNDAESTALQNYVDAIREYEQTGTITMRDWQGEPVYVKDQKVAGAAIPRTLSGDEALKYIQEGGGTSVTHHRNRATVASLRDLLNQNLGLDSDLYGTDTFGGEGFTWGSDNQQYANSLSGLQDFYRQQYGNIGSSQDILNRRLSDLAGGLSPEQIASGSDISRLEAATPEQISQINALKALMGQEDIYSPEMYGETTQGDYTQTSDIMDILSRFNR